MQNLPFKTADDFKVELARRSLLDFTCYTKPDYFVNWHHKVLCDVLDKFVNKEIKRLMVFMPPRHGKSELVSRRLPSYLLGRHPDDSIISCSYAADLSSRMNRDCQRILDDDLYKNVFPNTRIYSKNIRTVAGDTWLRNNDIFEVVGRKGVYRSAGVGGGITGMGMHWGIIDDPIKNKEEASSETYRNNVWEWYTSTFFTRLEKNGSILITVTRWNEDDLPGRILSKNADKWTIISFPALSDDYISELDKRKAGEALWPKKYDLKALSEIKTEIGSMDWNALYQQRPTSLEGGIFKRDWFHYYDLLPKVKRSVWSWDTAVKKGQYNDYSVGVLICEGIHGGYFVERIIRIKADFPEVKKAIEQAYHSFKSNYILIEDKSSGESLVQEIKRDKLLPVIPISKTTDKQFNAHECSPLAEAGYVYLKNNTEWLSEFIHELTTFPNAKNDDQVDAFSQALNYLKDKHKGFLDPDKLIIGGSRIKTDFVDFFNR